MTTAKRRKLLLIVWVAFVTRCLFYCLQQPMWEGYDEWSHFAYIQHIVEHGRLPARGDTVSKEIRASLGLMPSPYGLRDFKLPLTTHEDYWRLPREERLARKRLLVAIPTGLRNEPDDSLVLYEAQQPPLYYLMLSLPYRIFRNATLPARILLLRVLSVLIASLVVPLGYSTARQVFGPGGTALGITILISVMPEFMIDVCRVGNECLAVVIVSALMLSALRLVRREAGWRAWALAGTLLGAGLLTKAYVLAFVPLFVVIFAIRTLRVGGARQNLAGMILAFSLATAIAGGWYWRTWQRTGTVTGAQNDAAAAQFSVTEKLATVRKVDWVIAIDEFAYSHIWVGGWSFSFVRSWIYRVFELIAGVGALGFLLLSGRAVIRSWSRRTVGLFSGELAILASGYVLFCAGLAYDVVVDFLSSGIPATCGWYLYALIVPEFVLVGLGIASVVGRSSFRLAIALGSLVAAALDLYTVNFILVPYYTGIVAHRSSGVLSVFHISDLRHVGVWEIVQRLSANQPAMIGPPIIALMWVAYVCATAGLVATAFILNGSQPPARRSPEWLKNHSRVSASLTHPDSKIRSYAAWTWICCRPPGRVPVPVTATPL